MSRLRNIARTLYCGSELEGHIELRIKAVEGIARVFYWTVVDRRIVFLHQFVKKTDKTPARELRIAQNRMKDVTHG